ncbi:MAG: hypothetical protein ACI959_002071, partial [Limisphaerales bacterium]
MKTLRLLGVLTILLGLTNWANAQCTADAPLIVGPADQYAFQWCDGTSATLIGLQFAASASEYQFKKVSGTNLMTLNPTGGGYIRMGDP